MKRFFTAAAILLLLAALAAASAGGGSSTDPLVSQSYVDGDYTSDVLAKGASAIDSALGKVLDNASARLNGSTGYTVASGYAALVVPERGTVDMTTGTSAIITSGSATISVSSGSVIDVSTGDERTGSFTMEKNHRYFCVEDTSASVTAAERSVVSVNGAYYAPKAEPVLTQYRDVNPENWFYDAAKYIYDNKFYHDYAESSFKPNTDTTRAELVYALWVACGSPKPGSAATFLDIEHGWYFDATSWAAENDIVRGYEGNIFMPYNSITRQEIAVIMYRYAAYMGYSTSGDNDLSGYVDVGEVGDWANREMRWANAEGLITGTTTVNLAPRKTATRAEIATIIMRYLKSR